MDYVFKPLLSYDKFQCVSIENSTVGLDNGMIQGSSFSTFSGTKSGVYGHVSVVERVYKELLKVISKCLLTIDVVFRMFSDYKQTIEAESVETNKIKGVSVTEFSQEDFQIKEDTYLYNRVWDSSEYTIPSSENMAFFIMTNVIITPNQTMGSCPGDALTKGTKVSAIESGRRTLYGNSGRSIESWCPKENHVFPLKNSRAVLEEAENYTVTIVNSIYFPDLGPEYRRNNIKQLRGDDDHESCLYNKTTDPLCPTFRIKDLVEMAGEKFSEIAFKGAAMGITITWDCNLHHDFMKYCLPKYSVRRLDVKNCSLSGGWNFRHSQHHEFGRRTLYTLYGIKFFVDVRAKGSMINFNKILINFAKGLASFDVVNKFLYGFVPKPIEWCVNCKKRCQTQQHQENPLATEETPLSKSEHVDEVALPIPQA